ncbi:AAA family ATPase [Pectobacterium aquaticum]|uniref:Protein CR006 P-loop domain-containing protein n=1 Tax=Pectobacterium aquaticum TaxID=2204145 RepID=A0AA93AIE0_9GAMM|nr:AAA family ATPase [Pectobacterium aquaticum]RRO10167.1 hypothetical protein DMB84_020510 [Pectobacterium aquaticum]
MELRLKNVTSYNKNNFTKLNLNAKINILYGQNGSGKSTISNFFYKPNDKAFDECECQSLENYRPLVYNLKFIEDNFYNKNEQKGIFTLSKDNAVIEKEITDKEIVKKSLTEQYREKKGIKEKLEKDNENANNICIESVWSKTESIRSSQLRNLMSGSLGSKKSFFSKIKDLPRLPSINLNLLAEEYSELLKHKNSELPLITTMNLQEMSTNEVNLLTTPIIGSNNSYLSETIKRLGNLDWIKKGKELYIRNQTCPFCQENTITPEFTTAIESIFDESYSNRVNKIKLIKENYQNNDNIHFDKIKNDIESCEILNNTEKKKITNDILILEKIFQNNLNRINEKINTPSIQVDLERDHAIENSLIYDITECNKKITEINNKVRKFKENENSIKGKIWGGIRDLCNAEFEKLNEQETAIKAEHERIDKEIEDIVKNGKENNKKIKELRSQVSNIDETIDSINLKLKSLGITGFSIEKHYEAENSYAISRPEPYDGDNVYKSLSEGEKTLITFLYFLECCKGKTDKNDEDERDLFVVIDDPISSLSQNYIYDIASIIHYEIIENPITRKVLILTHNLYFFHELIKLSPKSKKDKIFKRDYHLGRITKNDFSKFSDIEKNSLQNEYQSLWQILKDAENGNINKVIVPNVMRNILEYYFAFVHKTDELQSQLNELAKNEENNNFKAFFRFINRGSHSDSTNITDMGDISPEAYMKQLRNIFMLMGNEQHYIKMIEEKDDGDDVATAQATH